MSKGRIVYLNGEYLEQAQAKVSVFDRGFLFGDGVYEVIPVLQGKLVDEAYSVERLARSLDAISMAWPCPQADYLQMLRELTARNDLQEGGIYVQVTRGVAERDFAYPANVPTTIMAFTHARSLLANPLAEKGVSVVTVPDMRWQRRDIKSLNLLAQCMAKQEAVAHGAFEAWMVEDSRVTEGSSSSAFIVKDGRIITRELSNSILPGIRRRVIVEMTEKQGLALDLRAFSVEEALHADEAFLSNASSLVLPVVSIDGKPVGDGKPGPITRQLRELYIASLLAEAAGK